MEDRKHKAMEEDTGLQSSVHTGQSSLEVPAVLSCFVIFGFWFLRGRLTLARADVELMKWLRPVLNLLSSVLKHSSIRISGVRHLPS